MRKYNLKNDTIKESDLQKVYNYDINPTEFIITTDKGFVNIEDGRMGGILCFCFYIKVTNRSTLSRV